jgi:hypothetical protein
MAGALSLHVSGDASTLVDYKFAYIMRDDSGSITEAGVRFYQGAMVTEAQKQTDGSTKNVTYYKRAQRIAVFPAALIRSNSSPTAWAIPSSYLPPTRLEKSKRTMSCASF